MPTVVVVDDQPVFRDVLRHILDDEFVVVAEADNYADAVAAVERHRPDAAIVDINIATHADEAHADGLQLAKELAALHPTIRIVLVSGYAEKTYAELARNIPRTVFVAKANLTDDLLRELIPT